MKKTGSILWGILLVAAGIILGMNAFGITRIDLFFSGWWTLFIIVPCVNGLLTGYDKSGSLIGICVGVLLLLCCQGFLDFDVLWKLLAPAIVVIIGVKIILRSVWENRGWQGYRQLEADNAGVKSGAATFSGTTLDYTGEVFEGARLDAVFGGIRCDLRGAVIQGDCVIDATSVFGGIDIYVPEHMNVKVRSNSIFGGVSGQERRNDPANQHTLYLNATCLFGGVEIK